MIVAVRVLQVEKHLTWKWFVVLAQVRRVLQLPRLLLPKLLRHRHLKQENQNQQSCPRLQLGARLILALMMEIRHQYLLPHQTFVTFLFQEERG
jgi:hypothetical protein